MEFRYICVHLRMICKNLDNKSMVRIENPPAVIGEPSAVIDDPLCCCRLRKFVFAGGPAKGFPPAVI